MQWLEGRFRHAADCDSGPLHIMYGIYGREDLPEEELPPLEGYRGSAPVRIGNGAEQLGNFPQAFTHLALISAAHNLDRQLG